MRQNFQQYVESDLNRPEPFSFIFKQLTWKFRYRPSFLIIGAQKAGTTSLYEYLLLHPNVRPTYHKEVHFFDMNFHRSETWYRAHFPLCRPALRNETKSIVGDATPYYLFHPLVPQRVAGLYPNVKLICLLRNPIDRAFSHYNHNKRKGREKRSFEDAVRDEIQWIAEEKKLLLEKPDYYSQLHRHFSYLARGVYIDQLELWLQSIDRKNLLILESGEFYGNTEKVLREVCTFIGISPLQQDWFAVHNKQHYSSSLSKESREQLASYYHPHNLKLYKLLEKDFGWR